MPATQPSKELRALCYEHHVEMRPDQRISNSKVIGTHTLGYACTQPECLVCYSIPNGYFILNQNGNGNALEAAPRVPCPRDGAPMYLAETDLEKKEFRLWRCPQCDARHTNEEGLIGSASKEIQDLAGKGEVES